MTWLPLAALILAADGREVKVLARGAWPHLPTHTLPADRDQHNRTIRSADELTKAAGRGALVTVPAALKVKAIDFEKQMLLAVEDGTQPLVGVSGGGPPSAPLAVTITAVTVDDAGKVMTVHWQRIPRGKEHGVLTRPLEAVLVDRFAGAVKFHKLPDRTAGGADPPAPAGPAWAARGRAFWPNGWPPEAPRQEWVVRGRAELIDARLAAPEHVLEQMRAEAAARYAKALGVAAIDFDKQMVAGVSGGVRPAGAAVEVTRAEADAAGKTLTVFWRVRDPAAGGVAAGIAHPAAVALFERFAGEVKFQEESAKKE